MSAIAEQLAPIAGASRLYMMAVDAIRRNMPGGVNDAMVGRFVDRIAEREPLLAEMVGREHLLCAAVVYLDRIAADMRGDVREEARCIVPQSLAGRASSQPYSSLADRGVPHGQPGVAREEPSSTGQTSTGDQRPDAGRDARGRGQPSLVPRTTSAPPARPSSTVRAAALAARASIATTVLDSFKVRGGQPIGDIVFAELPGLISQNTRESAVLRQIQKHAANVPGNARVRDVMKVADIERFIQRAAEMEDALA